MANRREFTTAVKWQIRKRSMGQCECHLMSADIRHLFPATCSRPASEIDHIYADCLESAEAKQEPLTADEGADLCEVCHAIKTVTDQKYRKKRNTHEVRKDRPKSGWWPAARKMPKRANPWPPKGARKFPKRGG